MNKFKIGIFATLAIAAIAVPLTVSNSVAQTQAGQGQAGNPPVAGPTGGFRGQGQFGQGQQGQAGGFQGQRGGGFQNDQQGRNPFQGQAMMAGGGGGGTTMVEEGSYLYIVQGNRMFKVQKGDLKVVVTGELPRPVPQNQTGFQGGAPVGGGQRNGGGGGAK